MLANGHERWVSHWNREGGPLDIVAIAVSLIVILGGLFIFNTASKEYGMTGLRTQTANGVPVMTPTIIPAPDSAPRQ